MGVLNKGTCLKIASLKFSLAWGDDKSGQT